MSLGIKNSNIDKKHEYKRKQTDVWRGGKASGSSAICSLFLLTQEMEMT